MILIYTPEQSPRISFITKFLFSEILNVPCLITSSLDNFSGFDGPKINYSRKITKCISIRPQLLLFETGTRHEVPEVSIVQNMEVLFPISDKSSLPFDPFAAAFYMITRYEEYLLQPLDMHDRVLVTESIAYKNGFLNKAVVDQWALWLREIIKKHYPGFHFPERIYHFIPTVDVDIAYAYRHRSWFRTIGAESKAIFTGDWLDSTRRFQTLIFSKPDPYDTFELFQSWFAKFDLHPRYFFLVGKYGKYDKNISSANPFMQELIIRINNEYEVGIHPSYRSNNSKDDLQSEIARLSNILDRKITISRQHFLKLGFPETYQQLIENGITEDYSMGYASLPGFRAGTCTPFLFYDLSTETETSLRIFPFQVMDGTLNQYMKLSPVEALDECKKLIEEVKKVNGTFISLWHNESLSEIREWTGWRDVYYKLLEAALE